MSATLTERESLTELCTRLASEWGITAKTVRGWGPCREIGDDLPAEFATASSGDLQWWLHWAIRDARDIDPSVRAEHLVRLKGHWLYCTICYATDIDPLVRAKHLVRLDGRWLYRVICVATDIDPLVRAKHLVRLKREWLYWAIRYATDIDSSVRESYRTKGGAH